MEIIYLGHSSFLLKGKQTSVVTDPFDPKKLGLKFPKVSAQIVTVSHDHSDHNHTSAVSGVNKIFSSPGEYEIQGVTILGFPSFHDNKKGELRGKNTLFLIEVDGIRLLHLGDLGHKLSEKTIERLGEIDILFVHVGGSATMTPEATATQVQTLEPKLVIPMHYKVPGLAPETASKLTSVEDFTKALGIKVTKEKKLRIKSSELASEEQAIVILEKR